MTTPRDSAAIRTRMGTALEAIPKGGAGWTKADPKSGAGPIKITLPWPVLTNERMMSVIMGKHSRMILTPEARRYKESVGKELLSQEYRPVRGRLEASIIAYAPSDKVDVDAWQKCAFDAMEGSIYHNDNQIKVLRRVEMRVDKANPRVEIELHHDDTFFGV